MNAATQLSLPTHKDLPETDGLPMQNALQAFQIAMLTAILRPVLDALYPDGRYFIGQDVGIYYRITDPPLKGCRAPDWFYVPDISNLLDSDFRRSYVLWQEHEPPVLVVEFSAEDGAEEHDSTPDTGKFWIYERAICAAYYAIFNVNNSTLELYQLVDGRYRPVRPNAAGRFPMRPLGVELGVWTGPYMNFGVLPWLRAYRPDGTLLPLPEETAESERNRAQKERERAKQEAHRALEERERAERERQDKERAAAEVERLRKKLQELGIDPEQI